MPEYKIEGQVCIMTCSPMMEPFFERYDDYPDGRTRFLIHQRPKYLEETNQECPSQNK